LSWFLHGVLHSISVLTFPIVIFMKEEEIQYITFQVFNQRKNVFSLEISMVKRSGSLSDLFAFANATGFLTAVSTFNFDSTLVFRAHVIIHRCKLWNKSRFMTPKSLAFFFSSQLS